MNQNTSLVLDTCEQTNISFLIQSEQIQYLTSVKVVPERLGKYTSLDLKVLILLIFQVYESLVPGSLFHKRGPLAYVPTNNFLFKLRKAKTRILNLIAFNRFAGICFQKWKRQCISENEKTPFYIV